MLKNMIELLLDWLDRQMEVDTVIHTPLYTNY